MADNDLNEVIEETVDDATVVTVNIDDTLTVSGEAADAKAVGDALALKADRSELQNSITVNGQSADNQGHIIVDASEIEMSSDDTTTVKAAIEAVDGKTGADIPISSGSGASSIKAAVEAVDSKTAQNIPMSSAEGAATVSAKIAAMDQTDLDLALAVQGVGNRTGADIPVSGNGSTKIEAALAARLKSVNGILGDADGNVQVDEVPFADNLRSSLSQNTVGTFSLRTAGGSASIEDGDAWLTGIRGNRIHTGYVAEQLNMTVTPVEREAGEESIAATIDRDTFVAYVTESGTTTLTYTTSWSASPTLYGITVTGTPKNGDVITVVYVKEDRGTITQATPTSMVATGWNLYNHDLGYARAVKYSDSMGFCISGTYSALKFSTTLDGAQSTITPVDGYFNISNNGYIWVTGGNATDTEIYMTWSDWLDPTDHPEFAAYSEDVIDLSEIMGTYFPYGLLRAGDVRDELNLNAGLALSNVERLSYNAENLAAAVASGRTYECDTNYIYLERATAVTSEITLDGGYTASDHGIEYFTGSTVPVYAIILYGNNLKNKLERDVVTKSSDVVNGFTSEATDKALSAAAGKVLFDQIGTLSSNLAMKTASGGWSYIELPNKLCICWNRISFGNLSTTSSGSLYIATTPQVDLPFTFASTPYFLAQRDAGEGFGGIMGNQVMGSTTKTPSYTIARPSSGTLYSVQLDMIVIGVKA